MGRYSWPAGSQNEASIAGGRLAEQLRARVGLSGWALDASVYAGLTELLATSPEVFNVRSFGARGDGVTNDASAIQAADAAASTAGAVLHFPSGTYKLEGGSTLAVSASWQGAPGAIIDVSAMDLAQQEGACEWSAQTDRSIMGIRWRDTADTLKIPIVLRGCSRFLIAANLFEQTTNTGNVACVDILPGTGTSSSGDIVVTDNVFRPTNIAVLVQGNATWTHYQIVIGNNVVDGVNAVFAADGVIKIDGAGGTCRDVTISGNTVIGDDSTWVRGIVVEEGVDGCTIVGNVIRDFTTQGIFVNEGQQDVAVNGVTIIGNHIEDCSIGIEIDPGTVGFDDVAIVGNVIRNVGANGIRNALAGVSGLLIANNVVDEYAGTSSTAGILISSANAVVANNYVNRAAAASTSSESLRLNSSSGTGCRVSDNQFLAANTAGDYYTSAVAAASMHLRGNSGAVTVNQGTATVANGATTAVVTHGLGGGATVTLTPTDVQLTPTNNLGNATKFWVTAIGATTFTINVDSDPGATTATFRWRASVFGE